jgi:hypothetical protein
LKSDSHITSTDDELWQAVVAKDARYDGRFVFAVSSTKITVDHRVLYAVLIATMLVLFTGGGGASWLSRVPEM